MHINREECEKESIEGKRIRKASVSRKRGWLEKRKEEVGSFPSFGFCGQL